jgi:DNA-binding XRE family transcriptional regulator
MSMSHPQHETTQWTTWEEVKERYPVDPALAERARVELEAEITGYELAQLRKERGITQTELAKKMGVSQARVSHIERGNIDHIELATVRAYVQALGGTVRIVADLGARSVDIKPTGDTAAA